MEVAFGMRGRVDPEKVFDATERRGLLSRTSMPGLTGKLRVLAALAIMITVATPACAQHHHKKLAREQIVELEAQFRQAQLTTDISMMDRLLSDDYLGIGVNGEVSTKPQQLDRMRSRDLILTRIDTSDFKVKLIGQIAIVTSLADVDGTLDGSPLHGMVRYTRIYQRLPSGIWKITNFEATRIPPRRERDIAAHQGPKPNEFRP
jgi:ketosteroid isomerase-like protein